MPKTSQDNGSQYDASYYQQINDEEAPQAERLADILVWYYRPKSVIDIGCATGLYLKPFYQRKIDIYGVDYAESAFDTALLQVPRTKIHRQDITTTAAKHLADLALCIEVLEHIPADGAATAVRFICHSADAVVFSAAQPGQGGVGHINCQPKAYWEALFATNGFRRNHLDEEHLLTLMAAGYHLGWLLNNLMIFQKNSVAKKVD